jgi:hypothetical protein
MRLVALAASAVGLWQVFFALTEFHRVVWVQLGFGLACLGLAALAWKR